ncbi:MAG: DNA polymerase III subunit beta [bacterium]|nr:DNA polymerase III subunit beta [bacterium]
MKTTILKEVLREGLGIVGRISQKNLSLPILSSVLMTGEKNFICFKATDLEIGVKIWILSKVEKEGAIACPIRVLQGLIESLSSEKISLESEDKKLLIEAGNFRSQINCVDADDFPIIPEIEAKTDFTIEASQLIEGLSRVVDVASTSSVKPEIAGVYFKFNGNNLKMVATDSFRLAEKTIILDKSINQEISFILPQRACREIINIFAASSGDLKFYLASNQILIEEMMKEASHPKTHFFCRLVEGDYPDYQGIIPQSFRLKANLQKNDFFQQLKTVSLFSNKINEVKIAAKQGKQELELESQNPEVGKSTSVVPAKVESEQSVEVSFNWRFLADGLNQIKSKDLVFSLSENDGPAVLQSKEDPGFLYLLMPLRV